VRRRKHHVACDSVTSLVGESKDALGLHASRSLQGDVSTDINPKTVFFTLFHLLCLYNLFYSSDHAFSNYD
jgi:hypothetical protein